MFFFITNPYNVWDERETKTETT